MKYKVDVVRIRENSITLNGWALGKTPESKVTFRVEDEHHQPVKCKMVSTRRDDVSQIYFKKVIDKEFGFDIQFPYERGKSYWLLIRCDGRQAKIKYNEELITKRASVAHKRMEKIKDLMNMETVHVALDFWKENGLRALIKKSCHKIQGLDNDYDYGEWYDLTKPTDEDLKAQRETHFDYEPLFSVVIPVYKTPERYLKEMLDSILDQTYGQWEVCIADGSPRGQDVGKVLKKYAEKDPRIHYEILGGNRGISGNTNAALSMATGDFVILADHDDTIPPQAFYEVAKAINKHPECDVLYSDEDKLDMDGKALFDPHFKPDFNPDLLTSVNYICHLFVVKKELLDRVGGFRQEFDGAQDYDFIFRCTEQAKEIVHIPQVLYHWRCHQDSTASNPESKMYAFEAGSRAIMAHYERMGIAAEQVEKGVDYGIYHTTFKVKGEPLVSIIIPNKDHSKDLDVCVRSILEKSTYRNLEFIVVENNSTEPETFAYYKEMEEKHPAFHVVTWKEGFNYSAINNFGASFAKGEYLLLLNNDTELLEPDSIREMLGFCQREDVGIAGARLLYADDTIQHAGVVIGFGGIAGHTFIGLHKTENSYFHRAMCAQDYSAVTAACLMTKKSVFDAVGGLSTELAVAFNDIDYCMKVRALGKLVVYAPYATLYHYESKSRGLEDTPEKVARFNREVAIFIKKWPDIIKNGDPYYNPNLTLRKSNFALRDLLKEKIGEPYDLSVYDKFAPEEKRAMSNAAKVTVVIPNYNGLKFMEPCFKALDMQICRDFEILVVDNGSTDGSVEWLKEHEIPSIFLETNIGFSGAVNVGIKASKTPYVILLNNDTEPDCHYIGEMIKAMERSPKIFSVSSKMIQLYDHSKMDDAGDMYTLMGWAFQRGVGRPSTGYNHVCRVFSACAGAAIYRREVFETVGYFDEMHFAYLEDIDVGYRARIYGYDNIYCPTAIVYHVGSGTSGSRYNSFKVRLAARNNIYLNYKNMPLLQLVLNCIPLGLGILVKYGFFKKIGFGKDYIDGLKEGFKTAKLCKKVKYEKKHLKNYLAIEWGLCTGTVLYIREFLSRQAAKL